MNSTLLRSTAKRIEEGAFGIVGRQAEEASALRKAASELEKHEIKPVINTINKPHMVKGACKCWLCDGLDRKYRYYR